MNPHNRRRIRNYAAVAFLALTWLVLSMPAPASAACQSLPGRSGLDQYCESIPGPGGDHGAGGGGHGGRALSRGVQHALAAAGPNGQALIQLSQSGPRGQAKGKKGAVHGRTDANTGSASEPSDNPLSAVRSAASTGSSVGPSFLWILLALVIVISALGWIRYRRRTPPAAE